MTRAGFDSGVHPGRLTGMRAGRFASWLPLLALAACGGAPAYVPPSTAGTPLAVTTTAPGTFVQVYSGSDGLGHTVTLQVDAVGTVVMDYTAVVTPANGTAQTISHSGTWASLIGVGTFWFATDVVSFPDAVTPSLTDSDAVAGTLQLADNGAFTLVLTVTTVRYPGGTTPSQTTVTQVTYTGTIVSGST